MLPNQIQNALQNLTALGGNVNVSPIPTILHLGPPLINSRGPPRTGEKRDARGYRIFDPEPEFIDLNLPPEDRRPFSTPANLENVEWQSEISSPQYTPRRRKGSIPPSLSPFSPSVSFDHSFPDRVQYTSDIYNTLALGRGKIEALIDSLSTLNFLFLSSVFRFFFDVLELYIALAFLLAVYYWSSKAVGWLPLPYVLDADSFREFSSIFARLFYFGEGWMSLPYSKEGVALVGAASRR